MTLHPATARWFELLTDREHIGRVLSCLADTDAVQLEAHSSLDATAALPDYARVLDGYSQLARRYRAYWPSVRVDSSAAAERSVDSVQADLVRLQAWAGEADPMIDTLQALEGERDAVNELARLLESAAAPLPDLRLLAGCGPQLGARLFGLPSDAPPLSLPPDVIHMGLQGERGRYLLTLGDAADLKLVDERLAAVHARRLALPDTLPGNSAEAIRFLGERQAQQELELKQQQARLEALGQRHGLPAILARFAFLDWLINNVPQLPATQHFAWVTGWTCDFEGKALGAALERAGLPGLLHFPDPPGGVNPPVLLSNPPWAKPFELFVRLLGTPGSSEADPSLLVALVAPVLFGFMFGDIGQGAVLLIAGLVLRRSYPSLRLLVPGGLAAIAFGFAFGSAFAREDWLTALWLRPLDEPLELLLTSMGIGVVVITLGMLIEGLEHGWRGAAGTWWRSRAGIVVLYLGLVAAPFLEGGKLVALAGLSWFLAGTLIATRSLRSLLQAVAELAETGLQLAVNTVSFARVGAFALAHAGLSAAVVGLGGAAGGRAGYWIALVLGNVLILALEGLVVSIQTTRLVLFEFFIRFLRGEGRPFKPLPPPQGRELRHR